MFGEMLQAGLKSQRPDECEALCRRSSGGSNGGDIDGAIRQAAPAASPNEQPTSYWLTRSSHRRRTGWAPRQWIDLLGPEIVDRCPAAAIAAAWHGIGTADPSTIVRSIRAGRKAAHRADDRPAPGRRLPIARRRPGERAGDGGSGGDRRGPAPATSGSCEGRRTGAQSLVGLRHGTRRQPGHAGGRQRARSASSSTPGLRKWPTRPRSRRDTSASSYSSRCTKAISTRRSGNLGGPSGSATPTTSMRSSWCWPCTRQRRWWAARRGRVDEARAESIRAQRLLARLGNLSPRSALRGYVAVAQARRSGGRLLRCPLPGPRGGQSPPA